jgi:hypothetical protein
LSTQTMELANSGLVFIMAAIPIAMVVFQAIVFLVRAWREALSLGIDTGILKRVVANSAVFSIIPSLPIILIMAVLMPALGKYIPWLRLSVLGSAMYENMAADMAVKTFGLFGVSDPALTPSIFISVVWVMTLGVVSYPFINAIFLKKYDGAMEKAKKQGGFAEVAIGALFIGVMAAYMPPMLTDFSNVPGLIAVLFSGIAVILLDRIAKKTGIGALGEFSFPLSMLIGMIAAIVSVSVFGVASPTM